VVGLIFRNELALDHTRRHDRAAGVSYLTVPDDACCFGGSASLVVRRPGA
jgi:hypothetical protein